MILRPGVASLLASLTLATPAIGQQAASTPASGAAPLGVLTRSVDIPFRQFTLANGLRVIVTTDRKAPVVAVSVWYDVGSRHEPAGKTGFAHLFEHLMFNGSENAPGEFFAALKDVGGTDYNGTTYYDRTNYFETVPKEALARALFLESDRMGYLLGAVTQTSLDTQRGVVQNEKRQGDNQPYGLVQYRMGEHLFPAGHPYAHQPIGSMADLDKASLADVKAWFRSHYGPNNAVLVLAGDIDEATARPLVERYFGGIPAGPVSVAPPAPVSVLPRAVDDMMTDTVAATRIMRTWPVPGITDPDAVLLEVAARILGGSDTARLSVALVNDHRLATKVEATNETLVKGGIFTITADVRDGVDPAAVRQRIDATLATFLEKGPDADEIQRVVTRLTAGRLQALDTMGGFGGKAATLAAGALTTGDAGYYRRELDAFAAATPATVRAAARRWLTHPAYTLTVTPGERPAYQEAVAVAAPAVPATPAAATPVAAGTRGPLPAVGQVGTLTFPTVQRARLSNGIELVYAQRASLPVTYVTINFDAGRAADDPARRGIQDLTMSVLSAATPTLDARAFGAQRDRLGMRVGAGGSADQSRVLMNVPSVNLMPALALFGDMVRRPPFADADLTRLRDRQLASIRGELADPFGLSSRIGARLVHGPQSPYALSGGSGNPAVVAAATRADLIAFQHAWLRPDKARIFVVSDRPFDEIRAALDARFGDWHETAPAGTKRFGQGQPASPRIVLIDRPGTPQSLITGWIPTDLPGDADILAPAAANEALGGGFLSRINMDLREDKHWTYGASGRFRPVAHAVPYSVTSSLQADRTGAAITAIRADMADFLTTAPLTAVEFERAVAGTMRELPGRYEDAGSVLGAMMTNDLFGRPDDYQTTIATRYRAMTLPQLQAALPAVIDPSRTIWVVVGDAAKVRPQLDGLGLPVELVTADSLK